MARSGKRERGNGAGGDARRGHRWHPSRSSRPLPPLWSRRLRHGGYFWDYLLTRRSINTSARCSQLCEFPGRWRLCICPWGLFPTPARSSQTSTNGRRHKPERRRAFFSTRWGSLAQRHVVWAGGGPSSSGLSRESLLIVVSPCAHRCAHLHVPTLVGGRLHVPALVSRSAGGHTGLPHTRGDTIPLG